MLSHPLCKHPVRCRIKATNRRETTWAKNALWKKIPVEKNLQISANGEHRQHGWQNLLKETIAEFSWRMAWKQNWTRIWAIDYKNRSHRQQMERLRQDASARCSFENVEALVPRDHKGELETQVLKRSNLHQLGCWGEDPCPYTSRTWPWGILKLISKISTKISVSDLLISWLMDKILSVAKEWQ